MKEKCIKACDRRKPPAERYKVIYVLKRFAGQHERMETKITSPKGIPLRVNRSVQAEGIFAFVKDDMNFRRFLLRVSVKAEAGRLLCPPALNILQLHHKIQKKCPGNGPVIPKAIPAGL